MICQLQQRFEIVDLGEASYLLGLAISRDAGTGSIRLSREAFARGILERFGMAERRPTTTPVEVGPISTREEELLSTELTDHFRTTTGSLLYLSR